MVLLDGDLGLANVDIQLGVTPQVDLAQILEQQWPLERAITPFPDGAFDIIAGRSGSQSLANMPAHRLFTLSSGIAGLGRAYDHVVIDLGAGIDRPVRFLAMQSGRSIVAHHHTSLRRLGGGQPLEAHGREDRGSTGRNCHLP